MVASGIQLDATKIALLRSAANTEQTDALHTVLKSVIGEGSANDQLPAGVYEDIIRQLLLRPGATGAPKLRTYDGPALATVRELLAVVDGEVANVSARAAQRSSSPRQQDVVDAMSAASALLPDYSLTKHALDFGVENAKKSSHLVCGYEVARHLAKSKEDTGLPAAREILGLLPKGYGQLIEMSSQSEAGGYTYSSPDSVDRYRQQIDADRRLISLTWHAAQVLPEGSNERESLLRARQDCLDSKPLLTISKGHNQVRALYASVRKVLDV